MIISYNALTQRRAVKTEKICGNRQKERKDTQNVREKS